MSDRAKIIACWLGACLLFTLIVGAADITPGYTFTTGEKNITHTKLNDAASGTVNVTFYTGKSAQTAVTGDTLLYYAAADAAFRKTTVGTLFGNAPAINGLSTINSVGDFSVATSKFTVASATGNTAVGGNLTVATNASITGTLGVIGATSLGTLTSTNGQALAGGLIGSGNWVWLSGTLTVNSGVPLTVEGVQTNKGAMVLGDAAGDTLTLNGTLAGTVQGTPTVSTTAKSTIAAADVLLIGDSADSSKLKGVVLSNVLRYATAQTYVPGASNTVTLAHNLGGIPQSFRLALVCTNADVATGYAVGDEVEGIVAKESSGAHEPLLLPRIDGTNVVVARQNGGGLELIPKTGGAWTAVTAETNWNLKIYTVRFP